MKAIQYLRHNTTSGPDGISATIPEGYCSSICGHLACLFNTSFSTDNILPSAWKISNVIPIHKKGDANLVQNYRTIYLLSLFGKLQEKLVHNLLLDHLLGRGAISPSQFGFRPSSSTQEALSATQTCHINMEDGFSTVCVFLDVVKAFGLVSHQDVIDALAGSGVCASLLVWFCDYLIERSQRVDCFSFLGGEPYSF